MAEIGETVVSSPRWPTGGLAFAFPFGNSRNEEVTPDALRDCGVRTFFRFTPLRTAVSMGNARTEQTSASRQP